MLTMRNIRIITTPIIFVALTLCLAETQASGINSKHILSIGEDSRFAYRFMIKDTVGFSFGRYETNRTYSNNAGQSYTRSYVQNAYAVRLNINPVDELRYFFHIELTRTDINYKRSTLNDSKNETMYYMYGIEYKLNRNFSVEGMVGLADSITYVRARELGQIDKVTGDFSPTTTLAINYTF